MRTPLKIALGVALMGAAAPALAQSDTYYGDADDVTVYGSRVPDDVTTLSQRVSYDDLDLRYAADREVLRGRVRDSAADVCERLGESDSGRSFGSSCRDDALNGAMRQVRYAERQYGPAYSYLSARRRDY
ncbi:UrcA family protein [Sphingomonas immobilis]|uniref:UrcA family protein n=1 Tax=Sphingomonas immobilis TaxID=3063997 RepID=A0ABT9A3T5_9SPHN|nr:UrcA family protein [Sphingomonas sp. CA1-15]MDO7844508.1 UrcA family protein [Sphingomonas sp. CA1-15]